jgi:hypothetical protein
MPWPHQEAPSARCSGSGRRRSAPPPSYVEAIHKEYEDGVIDLDTFEEKKQALLARVRID